MRLHSINLQQSRFAVIHSNPAPFGDLGDVQFGLNMP
jgi:hypothetical protein